MATNTEAWPNEPVCSFDRDQLLLLNDTFDALQRTNEVGDTGLTYVAAVGAAERFIGIPGIRWLGLNEPAPTSVARWLIPGTTEHDTLLRASTLAHALIARNTADTVQNPSTKLVGTAAALTIVLALLDRLLPIRARRLLRPLREDLVGLYNLDRGSVDQMHVPARAPVNVEPTAPLPRCRDPQRWFEESSPEHAALRSALEHTNDIFGRGGQLHDGGRSGAIATMDVVGDLLKQMLPQPSHPLIAALDVETEALIRLQRGKPSSLHRVPADVIRLGRKTREHSVFITAVVALAELRYESRATNETRPLIDGAVLQAATPLATHLGIGPFGDSAERLMRWRTPDYLGPIRGPWDINNSRNRLGESGLQRLRLKMIWRLADGGERDACIKALEQFLTVQNFSHLAPRRTTHDARGNAERQSRWRQRHRNG